MGFVRHAFHAGPALIGFVAPWPSWARAAELISKTNPYRALPNLGFTVSQLM
jgi:hypothetical protein